MTTPSPLMDDEETAHWFKLAFGEELADVDCEENRAYHVTPDSQDTYKGPTLVPFLPWWLFEGDKP